MSSSDYSKTYWNHQGTYEALSKELNKLIPNAGKVTAPKLERFRKASNYYYDLYNNGLCNYASVFTKTFGFSGRGELTQAKIDATDAKMDVFILEAAVEQGIDLTIKPVIREIPNTLEITAYFQCGKCIAELPSGVSPKEFARFNVGFTRLGVQIWCVRHECNVAHIDFQGQVHPANMIAAV